MSGAVALTLTLQIVAPLLKLCFAALALGVAARASVPARFALLWRWTGIAFVLSGCTDLAQGTWAALAYFERPGSVVYRAYLEWLSIGHQSRTGMMIGLAVLVIGLALRPGEARVAARAGLAVLVSGMLLGATVGWMEGPFTASVHWSAKAVLDTVEMLALFAALLVTLVHNRMDRLLWLALATYAVLHQALNVIWFTALAWIATPGAWSPSPLFIHLYTTTVLAVMVALAARRLALARRERPVPALLEPPVEAPLVGLR